MHFLVSDSRTTTTTTITCTTHEMHYNNNNICSAQALFGFAMLYTPGLVCGVLVTSFLSQLVVMMVMMIEMIVMDKQLVYYH
jgi:hypothetical protein